MYLICSYESYTDVGMLERLKVALWFVMEPLILKNDAAFVYGFYKRLIEKLKVHTVASDPANEALNKVRIIHWCNTHSLIPAFKAKYSRIQKLKKKNSNSSPIINFSA